MSCKITNFLEEVWTDFRKSKRNDFENSPPTGVEKNKLLLLAKKMNSLPEGKKYFKEVKVFKPKSSRKDSKESFIICKNLR